MGRILNTEQENRIQQETVCNVIKDSVNAGTINYETTKSNIRGHIFLDVLPFYIHDNDSIGLEKKYKRRVDKTKLRSL